MNYRAYRLLFPYVVAIASTGIGLLLTLWLKPFMTLSSSGFFLLAIILNTWYGGILPGIVTVVLSVLAINYFLIDPIHEFSLVDPDYLVRLGIFTVIALVINLLCAKLKESKSKVEQLSRKLQAESAQRLKTALNAAQMGMWDWDIKTGNISWSPEHENLFGLALGSFDGRYETFIACLHPDDRQSFHQSIEKSLKNHLPYQHEYRVIWADGSIHWIEARGKAFYNQQGQPVRMSGTIMAIDSRKQAEFDLEERKALLRLFIQYAPAGIAMFDREMRYLLTSQRWADEYHLGLPEFYIGRSHYEIFPEIPERWRQIHQRCLDGAIERCYEDLFIRADGTQQWISWEIHPWYIATGEIGGILVFSVDITKRKAAEIALQESQNQIQRQLAEIETIYHSAPIGLNVLDTELRFVRINQILATMNGFSVEAHIGKTIRELLPDLADTTEQLLRPILETGNPLFNVEITGETPAQPGVKRTWLESFLPLKNGDRIIGINTVCQEITERKQAEQDLARAALRIQTLFHTSFDGIVTLDWQGNVLDANPRFAKMLGYTLEEIAKLNIVDWDARFTSEELQQLLNDFIKLQTGVLETRHRRKDRSIYDVEISYSVINWQGEIIIFCACRDITERKQAELALQQLNAELEQRVAQRTAELADLYNKAPCGYHSLDVDGFIIRINETELKWLGYTREELLNKKRFIDLLAPESKENFSLYFFQLKQQGWMNNLEFEMVNKDGTIRWVNINASAVKDAAGNFIMSRSTLFDITDRKQIEKALLQSEETFRLLSEFSPIGIFLCDIKGKCIYTNPLYQKIIGTSAEDALGDGWEEFIHPEDREWVFQYWSELVTTGKEGVFNDLRYQDRQGKVCYTQVRTAPIRSIDGKIILFVGVVEDITERRKIDQMKKDLISVISHELRTPLTSIRGSLGLVAGGVYDRRPQKMKEMIAIAARQSDRLVRLVNDILDLRRLESGQAHFNFQFCAAADLIQQSVDVMRTQAEQNHITLSIIPSDVKVWADSDAIVQTLTNLLSNAIKFSPENSTITISTKIIHDRLITPQQLSSFALISVQDQGRGIPEDKLETIFGQFQQVDASDSREKGGTGLGLAICRNIVAQHGGKIWVESVLNQGSTFYFTLPLNDTNC